MELVEFPIVIFIHSHHFQCNSKIKQPIKPQSKTGNISTHHQTIHQKEQAQHWQNHQTKNRYLTEEDSQWQELASAAAWKVRRLLLLLLRT
jgi:hypothetical protein